MFLYIHHEGFFFPAAWRSPNIAGREGLALINSVFCLWEGGGGREAGQLLVF